MPNDANFCADGLIWPDRTPHPALYELKFLARPVTVESRGSGRFRIRNRRDFVDLSDLRGEWEVTVEGDVVRRGRLPPLRVPPGGALDVRARPAGPDLPGEGFVTFRFFLRRATEWAPAGHEVAWQQLPLSAAPARRAERLSRARPAEAGTQIVLEAGGTRAVLDHETGPLAELGAGRPERAPCRTAAAALARGDRQRRPPAAAGTEPAACSARWLALGSTASSGGSTRCAWRASRVDVAHVASGRGRWDDVRHRQSYRLLAADGLLVENEVRVGPDLRDLPRVGVVLVLVPGLEQLEWFGRGPWDDYQDRRASTVVATFRDTVTSQYVPYILPQEHGNHSDVRRLALTDAAGFGLEVLGRPLLGFTASHFTAADLFAAAHTCDLEPRSDVILSLDHAQRGSVRRAAGPTRIHAIALPQRATGSPTCSVREPDGERTAAPGDGRTTIVRPPRPVLRRYSAATAPAIASARSASLSTSTDPPKPPPSRRAPWAPAPSASLDEQVELGDRHLVVVAKAHVALAEEPARRGEVVALECGREPPHALVLRDDVPQPAAGDLVEAVESRGVDLGRARDAHQAECVLELGPALRIGRVLEAALDAGVGDQQAGALRHRDETVSEGRAVEHDRRPVPPEEAGGLVEDPARDSDRAQLCALAGEGELEGSSSNPAAAHSASATATSSGGGGREARPGRQVRRELPGDADRRPPEQRRARPRPPAHSGPIRQRAGRRRRRRRSEHPRSRST